MDTETKILLSDSEKLRLLTEHEGWGIVRAKLLEKIANLNSISDLNTTDANQLILDIKSNQKASQILLNWFQDIEGTVEQHKSNNSLLESRHSYIVRD